MSRTILTVGPQDHGRHMALDKFEGAEGQEGYLYELSRGVVTVSDVPRPRHLFQVDEARQQFSVYRAAHPKRIFRIASGGECKILVADLQSERHPDLAIYLSPPVEGEEDIWSTWIPAIVIEVVSPSSAYRDYEEKPEEYLRFGIREYWIIDEPKQQMLVLRRSRGRWTERVIRPDQPYRTGLLPGFEFDCGRVFAAAANLPGE